MIQRQSNFLSQQRIDVPHLRAQESSVAADFDLLAGKILAGGQALIVRGFELITSAVALNVTQASTLQVKVENSVIVHPLATESGSIFAVGAGVSSETLNASNSKVTGSFTANAINYVGIDLQRVADDSTSDLVMFLNASTLMETPKSVPLARTLSYRFQISTIDFDSTPNLAPIAKITVNSSGIVTAIEDCRQLFYRLGSGGSVPDSQHSYPWADGRLDGSSVSTLFSGGDKAITSNKDWQDAVMTRLWELGGGEAWFNATADRDLKMVFGQPVIPVVGENFDWDGTTFEWKSARVIFANTTAWYNTITDGTFALADGECVYVDIDRASNATVIPAKALLTALGSPTIPGSRFVFAWRKGSEVFVRDYPFEVGRNPVGLPPPAGDPLNVLFEGPSVYWDRIYEDMVVNVLDILTFSANTSGAVVNSLIEKDVTLNSPGFTATYEGPTATAVNLEDDMFSVPEVKVPSASPLAFSSGQVGFVKSNTGGGSNNVVTFTLDVTDALRQSPDIQTATITWTRYFYAGTSVTAAPTLDDAFVRGLDVTSGGSKELTISSGRRIQMLGGSAPVNSYVYLAYPDYMGSAISIMDNLTDVIVTNSFVYLGLAVNVLTESTGTVPEDYRVYRSINLQNGDIDLTVSPA